MIEAFAMKRVKSDKILKYDENFIPVSEDDGDELFPNGIFIFNITKMLAYIISNPENYIAESIDVKDFPLEFSSINEAHVDSVNISEPVIIAEIAPGRYNVIDGNHRMEKTRREGVKTILAYKLNVHHHIKFLTSKIAYEKYIEYWNEKLEDEDI